MVRESQVVGGSVPIASIPEGVEVKYGDPNATRLPVFGKYTLFPWGGGGWKGGM